MNVDQPFGQDEALSGVAAAWDVAVELKERRLNAHGVAIFSAVHALASGVPVVAVMDALKFPTEPPQKSSPYVLFGFGEESPPSRERAFAEWLGREVTSQIKQMTASDEEDDDE